MAGTTHLQRWSWQNAREYQFKALTEISDTERETYLARTYRAVGHVIHLLQDLSQPQHVRNEHHLDKYPFFRTETVWKSPIETYGFRNLDALNYNAVALNWRAAGFVKLRDFWYRLFYVYQGGQGPNVQALIDNENVVSRTLGLAEFVNGNFLGDRHLYREMFSPGDFEYYPYPSRDDPTATDWQLIKNNPSQYKKIGRLPKGASGDFYRFSIAKTGLGKQVVNHAAVHYLPTKHRFSPGVSPFVTIRDPDVLADYHDILIPKAVSFSAGLLNYFFRGKLEVTVTEEPGTGYRIRITNRSDDDFKGGAFTLYADDDDDLRTSVAMNIPSFDTLANGAWIEATFLDPLNRKNFTLVYQGTIGISASAALDVVDDGIAIAAKRFSLPCSRGNHPVSQLQWTLVDARLPEGSTLNLEGGSGSFSIKENGWFTYRASLPASCNEYEVTLTVDASMGVPNLEPPGFPGVAFLTIDFDGGDSPENFRQVRADGAHGAGCYGYPTQLSLTHNITVDGSPHSITIAFATQLWPTGEGTGCATSGTISLVPLTPP